MSGLRTGNRLQGTQDLTKMPRRIVGAAVLDKSLDCMTLDNAAAVPVFLLLQTGRSDFLALLRAG